MKEKLKWNAQQMLRNNQMWQPLCGVSIVSICTGHIIFITRLFLFPFFSFIGSTFCQFSPTLKCIRGSWDFMPFHVISHFVPIIFAATVFAIFSFTYYMVCTFMFILQPVNILSIMLDHSKYTFYTWRWYGGCCKCSFNFVWALKCSFSVAQHSFVTVQFE